MEVNGKETNDCVSENIKNSKKFEAFSLLSF